MQHEVQVRISGTAFTIPPGNSPFRVINDRGGGQSKETGALDFARDLAGAWGNRVQIHRRQSLRASRRWSGEIIIKGIV